MQTKTRQTVFNEMTKYIEDTADTFIFTDDTKREINERLVTLSNNCQLGYNEWNHTIRLYSIKDNKVKDILKIDEGSSFMYLLKDIVDVITDKEDLSELTYIDDLELQK